MTQVKCRTAGGKGMTQAAWKYILKRECAIENAVAWSRKKKEKADAEAKAKITLPKLKWMERNAPDSQG
jgi:hypothetical protein